MSETNGYIILGFIFLTAFIGLGFIISSSWKTHDMLRDLQQEVINAKTLDELYGALDALHIVHTKRCWHKTMHSKVHSLQLLISVKQAAIIYSQKQV